MPTSGITGLFGILNFINSCHTLSTWLCTFAFMSVTDESYSVLYMFCFEIES